VSGINNFFSHYYDHQREQSKVPKRLLSKLASYSVFKLDCLSVAESSRVQAAAASGVAWVNVRPSEPTMILHNDDYEMAFRMRYGLQMPATIRCLGDKCSNSGDSFHALYCGALGRKWVNQRHNKLARAVAKYAQLLGATTQLEPTHSIVDKDGVLIGDHVDVCISWGMGRDVWVDVVVSHPLALVY